MESLSQNNENQITSNRNARDAGRIQNSILKNLTPKRRMIRFKRMFITERDIYHDHVIRRRPAGSKGFISYSDYMKVVEAYIELSIEQLIKTGKLNLPFKLGKLRICKRYSEEPVGVDWAHFRKTGERIPFENEHSDNYVLKVVWDRTHYIHTNLIHKLKLARSVLSNLSSYSKENPWVLDNYQDITPR